MQLQRLEKNAINVSAVIPVLFKSPVNTLILDKTGITSPSDGKCVSIFKRILENILIVFLSLINLPGIGFADDKVYDVRMKNGKSFYGYTVTKSKNPSVIIIEKDGMLMELGKEDISSYILIKGARPSRKVYSRGALQTEASFRYTYSQLLNMDMELLSAMFNNLNNKVKFYGEERIRFLTNKNLLDNSRSTDLINLNEEYYKYSKEYDRVYKAIKAKRAIRAERKLDNGDWNSATELQNLVDDKVEYDIKYKY